MHKVNTENNFSYFFISLLFLLFSSALFEQFLNSSAQYLIESAMTLTVIVFIWSIKKEKLWIRSGIGAVVLIVLLTTLSLFIDLGRFAALHLMVMILFYLATILAAVKLVLFTGKIDHNSIVGALCIYLLLGIVWGFLYALLTILFTDAFNGLGNAPWHESFTDIMYFSFVTLTTLGYGDISPSIPIAKFCVYLQAIIGQFYVATFVASLIGIRLSDQQAALSARNKK